MIAFSPLALFLQSMHFSADASLESIGRQRQEVVEQSLDFV